MNRMLSSKLLHNISPILIPHSAHARLSVRLTCRKASRTSCLSLGTIRSNSSLHPSKSCAKSLVSPSGSSEQNKGDDHPIQEARLGIVFTCTAEACSHRSSHTFTKRAYERGIVIVQCPGCKNRCGLILILLLPNLIYPIRHLIADNLGWFKDSMEEGKLRNVEDILRVRGESVQKGTLDINGVVEFADGNGRG